MLLLMLDTQSSELIPAALLLFGFALVSLIGVFVATIRDLWHWGRTAETVPISRFGCSLISVAFLIMGLAQAGRALGRLSNMNAIFILLAGFTLLVVAGALDFWKANRR